MAQRAPVNVKIHRHIRDWVDDLATKNKRAGTTPILNKEIFESAMVRFLRHDPPRFDRWKLKSRDQLKHVQISFEVDSSIRDRIEDLSKKEYRDGNDSAHRSMALVVEEAVIQFLNEVLPDTKYKHPERK